MYDDDFFDITYTANPCLVTNVSKFRHYVNVHGRTKELLDFFGITRDVADDIYEFGYGCDTVEFAKNNIEFYKENRRQKELAILRNENLVLNFRDRQKDFCGHGYKKVKLFLNSIVKKGDYIAEAYRVLLEIEDKNIRAKETYGKYVEKVYNQKHSLINKMIDLSKEHGFSFGRQDSDVAKTSDIIYFDIEGCEQVSFHCDLDRDDVPIYEKEWDGLVNSTLSKLENAILHRYKEELEQYCNRKK